MQYYNIFYNDTNLHSSDGHFFTKDISGLGYSPEFKKTSVYGVDGSVLESCFVSDRQINIDLYFDRKDEQEIYKVFNIYKTGILSVNGYTIECMVENIDIQKMTCPATAKIQLYCEYPYFANGQGLKQKILQPDCPVFEFPKTFDGSFSFSREIVDNYTFNVDTDVNTYPSVQLIALEDISDPLYIKFFPTETPAAAKFIQIDYPLLQNEGLWIFTDLHGGLGSIPKVQKLHNGISTKINYFEAIKNSSAFFTLYPGSNSISVVPKLKIVLSYMEYKGGI